MLYMLNTKTSVEQKKLQHCSLLEPTNIQPTGVRSKSRSSALVQCDIPAMGMLLLPQESAVAKAVVKVGLSLAISGWLVKLSECRPMVMVNHIWHLVAAPAQPTPVTSEVAAWRHRKCIARQCLRWRLHLFLDTGLPISCP